MVVQHGEEKFLGRPDRTLSLLSGVLKERWRETFAPEPNGF